MSKNEGKRKLSIMKKIFENVNKKAWKCVECGCNNLAINSHLLQRHGILDNITENGHTCEVKPGDMMQWDAKTPPLFMFKDVGLQHAISMKIFCSEHDNSLFNEIEQGKVDFDSYRVQLLFSYRSLCAEIRKKEINKEINFRMRKSSELYNPEVERYLLAQDKGYDLSLRDMEVYRKELQAELLNPSGLFVFKPGS